MTLTPADIAALDQAHAAGNADLTHMVEQVRGYIAEHGFTIGAAIMAAELQAAGLDPTYLAALAGLAVARLATKD